MNTSPKQPHEERMKQVAQQFEYPATPDVARAVTKRLQNGNRPIVRVRGAWVIASFVILLIAVLFAVPGVRAEIVRFFQVGVVSIFPANETRAAVTPSPQIPLTATPQGTNTPFSSQTEPLYSVTTSGLAGETSLEEAREHLSFPIRLPTYPTDLGAPDLVFLQESEQMVILVWNEPDNPDSTRLSLHEIGPEIVIIQKFEPLVIQETQVNGKYAVWVQGPYLVQLTDGSYNWRRLVEGNTLIWEEDGITYRLESNLTLEETTFIAESLD